MSSTAYERDEVWDRVDLAIAATDQEAAERLNARKRFAEEVRMERLRRRWTVEIASVKAGLSAQTRQRVEHGKPVREGTLVKLDLLFDLPAGTLSSAFWHGTPTELSEKSLGSDDTPTGLSDTGVSDGDTSTGQAEKSASNGRLLESLAGLDVNGLRALRDLLDSLLSTLDAS